MRGGSLTSPRLKSAVPIHAMMSKRDRTEYERLGLFR